MATVKRSLLSELEDSASRLSRPTRGGKRSKTRHDDEGLRGRRLNLSPLQSSLTSISAPAKAAWETTIDELSADDLRNIFAFVPSFDRRDTVPVVCKTWLEICRNTPGLWHSVAVDGGATLERHGLPLIWARALPWLLARTQMRTLTIRLPAAPSEPEPPEENDENAEPHTPPPRSAKPCAAHTMPHGALSALAPALGTLHSLDLYLRCSLLHGRDLLMVSRLLGLRRLAVDAPMAAETLVEGLLTFSALSALTSLRLHASAPPPPPSAPVWIVQCASVEVARHQTPRQGELRAALPLDFGRLPELVDLSLSAEVGMLRLDEVPPGMLACTRLTSLRLAGCFGGASALPWDMGALSSLHTLMLEGWSLAEVAAPAPRPPTPPRGHRRQWLLEALDRLGALRRLRLASCHLRPPALPLVATHAPRLQELDVSGNALLFTAAGSPLEGAAVLQSVRALGDSCGELRRLRLATGTLPPAMVADRRPLWAEGAGLAFAVEA